MREHLEGLHHAYLISGLGESVLPEIISFWEAKAVKTKGNPDFNYITLKTFKIEDSRNLKELAAQKGLKSKKICIVSADNILPEAQNALLKLFEEPTPETHFYFVLPHIGALLPTFISRFYVIRTKTIPETKAAEKFISMSLFNRINFLKDLLNDEENGRRQALEFLNELETHLYSKTISNPKAMEQIFKARDYIRQPGSSVKNLLESVALVL